MEVNSGALLHSGGQLSLALAFLLTGMLSGFAAQALRACFPRKIALFLGGILCALIGALACILTASGQARAFMAVWAGIGYALYARTFGSLFACIGRKCPKLIDSCSNKIRALRFVSIIFK